MNDPKVLLEARFNPKVKSYWLLNGSMILLLTIVGAVLLPVWWILGIWATARYLDRMSCTLTERSLKVTRGILVRREMTVPLDKITDIGLVEGPIMRAMDLQAVRVETAGQSTAGAAVQLVGIENGRAFRDQVLRQRDLISDRGTGGSPAAIAAPAIDGGAEGLLTEIRDALVRIEARLPASTDDA